MGFNVIIDLLGSTIVGGILLLTLFKINGTAVENNYTGNGELIAQQNLATIVQILETDFRRIGYCDDWRKIPDPTQSILQVDSSMIKYLTDVDDDGNVDTVLYYLGGTNELTSTPNPRDRYLYRIINSESPVEVNLGVTQFKMNFFDALGNQLFFPISNPSAIYSMQIDVAVEDVSAYNEQYSTAFWRQIRLAAKNLRNR